MDEGGFDFGLGGSVMLKIGAWKVVVGEAMWVLDTNWISAGMVGVVGKLP